MLLYQYRGDRAQTTSGLASVPTSVTHHPLPCGKARLSLQTDRQEREEGSTTVKDAFRKTTPTDDLPMPPSFLPAAANSVLPNSRREIVYPGSSVNLCTYLQPEYSPCHGQQVQERSPYWTPFCHRRKRDLAASHNAILPEKQVVFQIAAHLCRPDMIDGIGTHVYRSTAFRA